MTLHDKLIHAITEYDRQESTKRGYNPNALGIMLGALHSADEYIAQGKDVRAVLCGHFTGRLLSRLLKVAGCEPMTKADAIGSGIRRTSY